MNNRYRDILLINNQPFEPKLIEELKNHHYRVTWYPTIEKAIDNDTFPFLTAILFKTSIPKEKLLTLLPQLLNSKKGVKLLIAIGHPTKTSTEDLFQKLGVSSSLTEPINFTMFLGLLNKFKKTPFSTDWHHVKGKKSVNLSNSKKRQHIFRYILSGFFLFILIILLLEFYFDYNSQKNENSSPKNNTTITKDTNQMIQNIINNK